MYYDATCEIIFQSDHSFNSYDQQSKCSIYVHHWMRLIRLRMKILASDTESDYAIRCTWVLLRHPSGLEQCVYKRSAERKQRHVKNLSSTLNGCHTIWNFVYTI